MPQGSGSPLLFVSFVNDCISILPSDGYLLYAEEIKIFLPISSLNDAATLQDHLNNFSSWCTSSGVERCIDKRCVITFGRPCNRIATAYTFSDIPVQRVHVVKDLVVWMDESLVFKEHINTTIRKARQTFGIVSRVHDEFDDPECLRTFYCCWVRPILHKNMDCRTPTENEMQFPNYLEYKPW